MQSTKQSKNKLKLKPKPNKISHLNMRKHGIKAIKRNAEIIDKIVSKFNRAFMTTYNVNLDNTGVRREATMVIGGVEPTQIRPGETFINNGMPIGIVTGAQQGAYGTTVTVEVNEHTAARLLMEFGDQNVCTQ